MKLKKDPAMAGQAYYNFIALTCAGLIIVAAANLGNILSALQWLVGVMSPLIIAFCVAYILNRPFNAITRFYARLFRKNGKGVRALALISTYIIALGFIVMFCAFILPAFFSSLSQLTTSLPSYYDNVSEWLSGIYERLGLDIELGDFDALFMSWTDAMNQLAGMITTYFDKILTFSIQVLGWIASFITGLMISVYILADKRRLRHALSKVLTGLLSEPAQKQCNAIFTNVNRTFSNYLSGRILDCAIFGAIAFIALNIAGIPYPLMLATTVAIINFVPVIGPVIGTMITAVIVLITAPEKLLVYLIIVIVLQTLDGNILAPRLLGRMTGLSTLWVILSIVFFGALFGVFGMITGVPLFGVIYSLLKIFIEQRALKRKKEAPPQSAADDDTQS